MKDLKDYILESAGTQVKDIFELRNLLAEKVQTRFKFDHCKERDEKSYKDKPYFKDITVDMIGVYGLMHEQHWSSAEVVTKYIISQSEKLAKQNGCEFEVGKTKYAWEHSSELRGWNTQYTQMTFTGQDLNGDIYIRLVARDKKTVEVDLFIKINK